MKEQLKEIIFIIKLLLITIKENWLWIIFMTTIYITAAFLLFFIGATVAKLAWSIA